MRLTAVIGGLVLAAGSAVGIAVAAGAGDSFAATGDSPEMKSVQALLAKARKPGSDKIGPFANDFIDIKKVKPNRNANVGGASGSFTEDCGTNQNNHHNSDNFIVTPGVDHGALHVHDYVGNRTTTARSNDRSLAAGGTTCANGDKSTFFWPVIRVKQEANGKNNNQQGPDKGNIGRLVEPNQVTIKFTSGGAGKVTAAPQFLRGIMGDAKEVTNGAANAKATWTCTGFENRVTNKYPVCPQGSAVERIMDFPSCWDGKNTDSANHRTHLVFPKNNGQCPKGTKAVPALQYTLVYNSVPNGSVFAVDGFDGQLHNPATDHADWENVMNSQQMNGVVSCINSGQQCVNQPQGGGKGGNAGAGGNNNGGTTGGGQGGNNGGGTTTTLTTTAASTTTTLTTTAASTTTARGNAGGGSTSGGKGGSGSGTGDSGGPASSQRVIQSDAPVQAPAVSNRAATTEGDGDLSQHSPQIEPAQGTDLATASPGTNTDPTEPAQDTDPTTAPSPTTDPAQGAVTASPTSTTDYGQQPATDYGQQQAQQGAQTETAASTSTDNRPNTVMVLGGVLLIVVLAVGAVTIIRRARGFSTTKGGGR
ncbi:DUF1996 domain-containing protein [Kutzneria kofuensis]|uniref:DUF1996 domain-containing protein n=3 Tax=Kutzneria kofuensis TaxID=103725 RepID=A0A7W9KFF4_9PSEU|nr:DUF1996 domain-containing protein [Kutzneria kofuensis]MBB5891430.1 hypothetical protein [Kutzneria kofuensis]